MILEEQPRLPLPPSLPLDWRDLVARLRASHELEPLDADMETLLKIGENLVYERSLYLVLVPHDARSSGR